MAFGLSFILLGLVLLYSQTGEALRCWACSSDMDPTCLDYFNTTKLQIQRTYYTNLHPSQRPEGPYLKECDSNLSRIYNQKAVCFKRVQTLPEGRQVTIRDCKIVPLSQTVGTCPSEPTGRHITNNFCEYCETDGCNGAPSVSTSSALLAVVIPAFLLLLRH